MLDKLITSFQFPKSYKIFFYVKLIVENHISETFSSNINQRKKIFEKLNEGIKTSMLPLNFHSIIELLFVFEPVLVPISEQTFDIERIYIIHFIIIKIPYYYIKALPGHFLHIQPSVCKKGWELPPLY